MDMIVIEVDEGQTEEDVFEVVKRVGPEWLWRYAAHCQDPDANRVYSLNGPGECSSVYQPWMLEHLQAKNGDYVPCFLNPQLVFGIVSIQTHLQERHGLSSRRVESLLADDAYRLHDQLHTKDEKETG